MRAPGSERGFSLIEALVAIAITVVAFSAAAQLLVQASAATRRARLVTRGAILAASKMEELDSLAFEVAADGSGVRDERLVESPDRSLVQDVPEYCDWFDSSGNPLADARGRPVGTVFVRRWSIRALDVSTDTLALQVIVTTGSDPPLAALTAVRTRRGG
jgi:prepilin-type N-terminal cleavage/methylation domain-containing protein